MLNCFADNIGYLGGGDTVVDLLMHLLVPRSKVKLLHQSMPVLMTIRFLLSIDVVALCNAYLMSSRSHVTPHLARPFFRFLPHPRFSHLKSIILAAYPSISHLVSRPSYILLGHSTLRKQLVKAKIVLN